jgi:hypothetical protein
VKLCTAKRKTTNIGEMKRKKKEIISGEITNISLRIARRKDISEGVKKMGKKKGKKEKRKKAE